MIKIYDQNTNMLAILEYADAVGYQLPHNDLWTATFRLPKGDPKNAFCQMHNLVSLDDGPRSLGMYRIVGEPEADVTEPGGYIAYNCEHVMATLLDDLLFGYHEVGGVTMDTAAVLRYILAQQDTIRWQLGICDFADHFSYKFENDTLLGAVMSLGNVLVEPYTWDFDTSTTPWTINLRKADTVASCGIYYKRNLQQIKRSIDASTLVTRLYLLGYGEGVNQLTIRDINNGLPYIDADTISVYGVKKSVFVDRRFENAEALKARGQALLEGLKIPYTTYTAKAADLVQLTGDAWDEYMPGKIVHVLDGEDGVEFEARIVNVGKNNVRGRRGDVDIVIANSPRDIADSINTLADRQGINDLYSQGATNLYAQQFADNADAEHPAVMRVFVPTGCVRINQMLVSFTAERFRAYATGASAGGSSNTTSESGGGTSTTSGSGGGTSTTSGNGGATTVSASAATSGSSYTYTGGQIGDAFPGHVHNMSHDHTIPAHSHAIGSHHHSFSVPDHTHSVDIPSHTHSVKVPSHTHSMVHGIYEGSAAKNIAIKVDGVTVPGVTGASASELDIAAYLEKDDEGKITRGCWHTVELVPDVLTRIEANLFVQAFVQSVGGGDY